MIQAKQVTLGILLILLWILYLSGGSAEPENARFSMQTEPSLIASSGMTSQAWEEEILWQKEEGLASFLTEDQILSLAPNAQIVREDRRIHMADHLEGLASVKTPMDAYRVLYRFVPLLGGTHLTELRLWSQLDMGAHRVYTFQQVYEGSSVTGSIVKMATDSRGQLTAVFSSLSSAFSESPARKDLTTAEAEEIVRQSLAQSGSEGSVLTEYTLRAFLTEDEYEETEGLSDPLVWVVYSEDSPSASHPYRAHFVRMDGTYLGNCEAASPQDPSALARDASFSVFQFMEPSEWSGAVKDGLGNCISVTVPVMRDTRTGAWFLGDPERKIAVADFSRLMYGDGKVSLSAYPDSESWDEEDLITYFNLIQVWDFYADCGWKGPDGAGTPVLLLRNLCTEDGEELYNTVYIGKEQGWQCFAYGGDRLIGSGLDIIAHEFTHCITETVMHSSLYQNDIGAIHEALSDIMGNLCEMICQGSREEDWLIGEDAGTAFRSMMNPHDFEQPEYIWDLYYGPGASSPNDLNDHGGVHYNSSILNYVAAHLCEDYGMPLMNARDFWLYTASILTPANSYVQMPEVLRWALSASGNSPYLDGLNTLIEKTRMAETDVPETLPENQVMVRLELPETPVFTDYDWFLFAAQIRTDFIARQRDALIDLVSHVLHMDLPIDAFMSRINAVLTALHLSPDAIEQEMPEGFSLTGWLSLVAHDLISTHASWESSENSGITMVLENLPTVYLLAAYSEEEDTVPGAYVFLGDGWFDLTPPADALASGDFNAIREQALPFFRRMISCLLMSPSDRQFMTLPADGLEWIDFDEPFYFPEGLPEDDLNSVGLLPMYPAFQFLRP